jgi:hypothetical protein
MKPMAWSRTSEDNRSGRKQHRSSAARVDVEDDGVAYRVSRLDSLDEDVRRGDAKTRTRTRAAGDDADQDEMQRGEGLH